MKRLLLFAAAAIALASCHSGAYAAGVDFQSIPGKGAPLYVQLPDGTFAPAQADSSSNLKVTGAAGGGDASAANQSSQITQETAINTVLGTKTDAKSTATDGTSVSVMQVLKQISASAQAGTSNTGSAVPSGAIFIGANSGGNLTGLIQADTSVPINVSTATDTQLIALSAGKKIYVTAWDVVAGGTGNAQLEYGTGTNCGTGTTALTGNYNLTAQAGISKGNGLGAVLVVPAGNALCIKTSAAVQMSGSVSATQF